jgi:hypothetical protein
MPATIDWIALAKARGLNIPDAELERIVGPLRVLEERFRPLVPGIPPRLTTATILRVGREQSE